MIRETYTTTHVDVPRTDGSVFRVTARGVLTPEDEEVFHLIEAAPKLLAALESLFDSYKQLADSGDAGNWRIEDQPEGKQAIAAMAAARGEKP